MHSKQHIFIIHSQIQSFYVIKHKFVHSHQYRSILTHRQPATNPHYIHYKDTINTHYIYSKTQPLSTLSTRSRMLHTANKSWIYISMCLMMCIIYRDITDMLWCVLGRLRLGLAVNRHTDWWISHVYIKHLKLFLDLHKYTHQIDKNYVCALNVSNWQPAL